MDPEPQLELKIYPEPVLLRRAEPFPPPGQGEPGDAGDDGSWETLRSRIGPMFRVMYQHGGIGLAGPQVGWARRIFVVNLTGDPEAPGEELVFVNPKVSSPTGTETLEEGCLSLPDIRADVTRAERVEVAARDAYGNPFTLTALGMFARCVQHEFDHLDGILFVTRLPITARLKVKRALKELERKYKESKQAG